MARWLCCQGPYPTVAVGRCATRIAYFPSRLQDVNARLSAPGVRRRWERVFATHTRSPRPHTHTPARQAHASARQCTRPCTSVHVGTDPPTRPHAHTPATAQTFARTGVRHVGVVANSRSCEQPFGPWPTPSPKAPPAAWERDPFTATPPPRLEPANLCQRHGVIGILCDGKKQRTNS